MPQKRTAQPGLCQGVIILLALEEFRFDVGLSEN